MASSALADTAFQHISPVPGETTSKVDLWCIYFPLMRSGTGPVSAILEVVKSDDAGQVWEGRTKVALFSRSTS